MLLDHHQSPVNALSSVIQSAGGPIAETIESARAAIVALRQPRTALMTARPHASGRSVPATREQAGARRRAHAGSRRADDERGVRHVRVAERPAAPEHRQAEARRARRAAPPGTGPSRRASAAAAAAQAKAPASDAHSNTNVAAPSSVPSAATPCANGLGTV